ncbi:hypothetical protein CFC21_083744, partial [Triticum aestivum]
MVNQVLLREQLLNDMHHQPHHFQRQLLNNSSKQKLGMAITGSNTMI